MKKIAAIFVLLLTLAGYSAEQYGAGVSNEITTVTVRDIVFDPSLRNKLVNLEGIIIAQCVSPEKCWFFLNDGTGNILINLKPEGFALPARIGKKARVTGVVTYTRGGLQIIARGVEVI